LIICRTRLNDPEKGYKGPRKEGLDFFVEHFVWKQLPKELFEGFGGRDADKLRRREILVSQGKGKLKEKEIVSEPVSEGSAVASSSASSAGDPTADGGLAEDMAFETVVKDELVTIKTEETTSILGKRTLEEANDDVKVSQSTSDAQAALESALEEAEFQALLLAQNEGKEEGNDVGQNESKEHEDISENYSLAPHVFAALPELMPPLVSIWEGRREKEVYWVPAVTWTMLETK
jgi:hypothetical protein